MDCLTDARRRHQPAYTQQWPWRFAERPGWLDALVTLLSDLMHDYNVPPEQVNGHNAWNATACPGRNLDAILPDIVAAAVRS